VDYLASFAALVKQELPNEAGPDSLNMLPALLGESKTGREMLAEHAGGVALRKGQWKFIPAGQGNPGRDGEGAGAAPRRPQAGAQLYNLAQDPAEAKNVARDNPEVVKELAEKLKDLRQKGRS